MSSFDDRKVPLLERDDSGLVDEIFCILNSQVHASAYGDHCSYAQCIAPLPRGLRAMAATHWLDLSLALDSITWHFGNFGEAGLVRATEEGLRELGLVELADCFVEVRNVMAPLLAQRVAEGADPYQLIQLAGLKEAAHEIDRSAWALDNLGAEGSLIYKSWIRYARNLPELVFDIPATGA